MELLVVTLARTIPDEDLDDVSQMRFVFDRVGNAEGLVSIRSYRSQEDETYYLSLTTWEDEEYWQKAQERHNPKRLMLSTASDLLISPPKQWLMHYLWGYSRPAAQPVLAAAHVASVRPEQAEYARRGWIESLRRQIAQPAFAISSACLARGVDEDSALTSSPGPSERTNEEAHYGSIFLNMLSWPDEANRDKFYTDPDYQAISRFLGRVGVIQMLTLEPL